jgi:hypothetical protein
MKLPNLSFVLIILCLIIGCKNANNKESAPMSIDLEQTVVDDQSFSAPPAPNAPKSVIRTAELRIKVKDVEKSLAQLEEMAKSIGGFVEYTNIESSEHGTTTKVISKDSLLQVTEYTVYGNITLRVPVTSFDSIVNTIQNAALFLNYRRTSAEDISLQYLENSLKAGVSKKSGNRIKDASESKGKKLDDIVEAETTASAMEQNAISNKIANFELQRRVNFSSIQVNLYQANQIYKESVTNINISDYKPSFGSRFLYALQNGWNGLVSFFIFLVNIWPVLAVVFVIYLMIRNRKFLFFKKNNNNNNQ